MQATTGYHQTGPQMNKFPPPLVDVRHMNGGMSSRYVHIQTPIIFT